MTQRIHCSFKILLSCYCTPLAGYGDVYGPRAITLSSDETALSEPNIQVRSKLAAQWLRVLSPGLVANHWPRPDPPKGGTYYHWCRGTQAPPYYTHRGSDRQVIGSHHIRVTSLLYLKKSGNLLAYRRLLTLLAEYRRRNKSYYNQKTRPSHTLASGLRQPSCRNGFEY
ncbi:hypothetical protein AVEN_197814-1 [Araneus ventricosus]|uniref:Secreted protein n=1 Tax=Araneus ventricosus TaxID=182803 RepID=A0A4Y2NPM9_ARAVE|nr:hypothetical protein AVEN_197814-1 [Araneus ventricosus]